MIWDWKASAKIFKLTVVLIAPNKNTEVIKIYLDTTINWNLLKQFHPKILINL